jgi:hypothetical protein
MDIESGKNQSTKQQEDKSAKLLQIVIVLETVIVILLLVILISGGAWMLRIPEANVQVQRDLTEAHGIGILKHMPLVERTLAGGWVGLTAPMLKGIQDHQITRCSARGVEVLNYASQGGTYKCVNDHLKKELTKTEKEHGLVGHLYYKEHGL